ncbi:MFS transporter [Streptomyces sp. NPDC048172]|uniref:MFS transporter n=1 Tax=Streptomyces sp. NPDC048172 TaxID=3365505 RepID=UPI003720C905
MNKARLGFLASTHTVNDLYQGAVPALLPFLMAQRHYSYADVSGIALAVTGLSSAGQPLFGILADRRPRDWMVPVGFLTAALGVAGIGLVHGYALTWLCAALAGLGLAAYHPPATSMARAAGGSSQKGMSVFAVGGTLGAALAPACVTFLVGVAGLRGTALLAIPALVTALVWAARSVRSPRPRRGRAPEAPPGSSTRRPARGVEGDAGDAGDAGVARDDWRAFRRLVATVVGWSIPYVTVTALVALHAERTLHVGPGKGAAVLTSFTAAGAVGTLLGGWAADRHGRTATVRAGYVLSVPALAGVVWAPDFPFLVAATVLSGAALFVPFAPQVTLAQDYLPTRPGTASGLTLGLTMSAGGLCSPLFGMLADAHGLRTALGAALAVFTVAVLGAAGLKEPRPYGHPVSVRDKPEPEPEPDGAAAGKR